jgi:hypothetical protein
MVVRVIDVNQSGEAPVLITLGEGGMEIAVNVTWGE